MRLLLVYGTAEGQPQKIARFVGDYLERQGHQRIVINATDATAAAEPRDFDAVIIAASIHMGRYQSVIIHFVIDHLADIDARPNAFLSVSLSAASEDEDDIEGLNKCVAGFSHETGWTPACLHHVKGAFHYTSYDFMKRWAMKYIAFRKGAPTYMSRDYELTDWGDLTRFLDSFSASSATVRPLSS
jgi:menaquinone-dependent protoporphyrinogen oxidase